ncbi:hypothetical protein [Brucella thiophenivorans]|uniref:Uncharacterized protein n=1 Tax=Brucella thiophenivorans TaxID=571255 RepID=A0A256FAE5_9HYPH|nr:hypothetical protein [Brucella thiophenivorans]OYR11676.1 hypothetical protein CEV31_3687 [Brucella thiophenivorans]
MQTPFGRSFLPQAEGESCHFVPFSIERGIYDRKDKKARNSDHRQT